MKYNIENKIDNINIKYDCLMMYLFKNKLINNIKLNNKEKKYIYKKIKKNNFIGKLNTYLTIKNKIFNKINYIIIIGCGKYKKINTEKFIKIIKYSYIFLKKKKFKNILLTLNNLNIKNNYWKIFNIIKNFEKLNYKFDKFKTKKNIKDNKTINFLVQKKNKNNKYKLYIKNSLIISKGIKISKNLSNTPANVCNSNYIYKKVKKYIKNKNIKISYINKKKIKKLKMNSYLSVNKGSKNKPIIILIKYKINKSKPIILIGKGITFDSGGISIKPSKNMWEMKYDMSGASSIYGIMYIVSKLKFNINITGILACAENMIDKNSTRPGDIIKTYSKKTVEIINTDAEGRLLLCDILSYVNIFNPKYVIDISTLTGSCIIALGNKISGLISNNKKLSKYLLKASKQSKDYLWELPLFKKYKKYLKSNFADIKNCSDYPYAGTIISACFLSYFTKKYKWAHIDIAGTSYNEKGSTGRPINLIIQFLINYNIKNNINEK